MKINLGDKVRESISGIVGIAIARSIWLTGCDRITIRPLGVDKEGKPKEQVTFDEQELEVVKPKIKKRSNNDKGGPRPELCKY